MAGPLRKESYPETTPHILIHSSSRLTIKGLSQYLRKEIKDRLTITNPAWEENQRMGRWNGDTPQFIYSYGVEKSAMWINTENREG